MAGVTTDLVIRQMRPADIPGVAELEVEVFPQPWSVMLFEEELGAPGRQYLVAEVDQRLAGYGGVMLVAEDAHITTIAVAPGQRGHKVGTRLMLALIDAAATHTARHLTLEVRVSNEAARRLYARFGFAPVGLRKNYYHNEDAVIMWATDIDTPTYAQTLRAIRETV